MERVRISRGLETVDHTIIPAGSEITLTKQWVNVPYNARARVIIDPQGKECRVFDEDLERALKGELEGEA